jgi:2-polyprenyl-3-methyl-5-hydroxy-6-metoxy-1,4-benzoquinol methylase
MGIGVLRAKDLDDYVVEIDKRGGMDFCPTKNHDFIKDFSYAYEVEVDQDLDPFSDLYLQQQLDLYKEISGRDYDPKTGEQNQVDTSYRKNAANPYGSVDVNFVAKHARTVLTSLIVSQLPANAKVLDMGCGWGMTSEIQSFCGCKVHAVDINPKFIDLVQSRADRIGYDTKAFESDFDSFKANSQYDLVFFYECLHHCLKPWETLKHLGKFLKPDGKITFAGEPVIYMHWKNWGIRFDWLSIYCIRKFGWLELVWTEEFIIQCFHKAGFKLNLLPRIGLEHGYIGVATHLENKGIKINSSSVLPPVYIFDEQQNAHIENAQGNIEILSKLEEVVKSTLFELEITLTNQSDQTWYISSGNPVRLSYHWQDLEGNEIEYNGNRTEINTSHIHPNDQLTQKMKILTPDYDGPANLVLTIVQEGIAWLENRGFDAPMLCLNIKP